MRGRRSPRRSERSGDCLRDLFPATLFWNSIAASTISPRCGSGWRRRCRRAVPWLLAEGRSLRAAAPLPPTRQADAVPMLPRIEGYHVIEHVDVGGMGVAYE